METDSDYAWVAPELTNPTLVTLPQGSSYTRLARDRDYIIQFPEVAKIGYTMIEGGRNVLIQNGHVSVPASAESDMQRRGLYIKNATGTVHIENMLIDGSNPQGFDAITISAPRATVQIVNVRVEGVTGRAEGFHGDVVQPFGGVAELRIDHLTGISNYQGLYLQETSGRIGTIDIRNVDLSYIPNPHDETTYLLWLPVNPKSCESHVVALNNVYIGARPGQDVAGFAVWPNRVAPEDCTATRNGEHVSWPRLPNVIGGVIAGAPPNGEFVPSGAVGVTGSLASPEVKEQAEHVGSPEPAIMPKTNEPQRWSLGRAGGGLAAGASRERRGLVKTWSALYRSSGIGSRNRRMQERNGAMSLWRVQWFTGAVSQGG